MGKLSLGHYTERDSEVESGEEHGDAGPTQAEICRNRNQIGQQRH